MCFYTAGPRSYLGCVDEVLEALDHSARCGAAALQPQIRDRDDPSTNDHAPILLIFSFFKNFI